MYNEELYASYWVILCDRLGKSASDKDAFDTMLALAEGHKESEDARGY